MKSDRESEKLSFKEKLKKFVKSLSQYMLEDNNQWTIKGFIDVYKNIYTISADTKLVSKILEIHLLPQLLRFAENNGYRIVLADHQNYYPDFSFIEIDNEEIKFAVDLKTTYRLPDNPDFCNGFTLGSHGTYFINRNSHKNVQFPYGQYLSHLCLGLIYSRYDLSETDETRIHAFDELKSITSVIGDFQFFACEKWELASGSQGSGNTANIGSIVRIKDILEGDGVFKNLGEEWFDNYWMNYGRMRVKSVDGKFKKLTKLNEFLKSRRRSLKLANPVIRPIRKRK